MRSAVWTVALVAMQFARCPALKKGGHGGKRLNSGLRAGHWENQGGRAAAPVEKEERKKRAASKAADAKARWQSWAAKPSAEPHGSCKHSSTEDGQDIEQGMPA